jgi:general secretion pathway protein F
MGELAVALEAGVPLEVAIAGETKRIPPHLRGLIVAGVQSGRVGDILARFGVYAGLGTDLKRRLLLSITYPLLTLVITIALLYGVSTYLVHQFEVIFKDFAIPLPMLTLFILKGARVIEIIAGPVAVILAALVITFLLGRVCLNPERRRSLSTRIPLFGPIWSAVRLSEFCHLLALLIEGRLPLPEALRLTGEGVADSGLNRGCALLAREVESGRSISDAMVKVRRFPAGLARLIGWAENEKTLPEVLHLAGVLFETQARSRATLAGTIVSVACVIMVLSLIVVIPGLFLPLITLISRLSG